MQGFNVVFKIGSHELEADRSSLIGALGGGECVVLAVDVSTCGIRRRIFALSSAECKYFTPANLCVLWGFRRVEPADLPNEVSKLLSAGADPNSLLPVADKECLDVTNGSARQRLSKCVNKAKRSAVLPTEEYVKQCGISRGVVEVLNNQAGVLKPCDTVLSRRA